MSSSFAFIVIVLACIASSAFGGMKCNSGDYAKYKITFWNFLSSDSATFRGVVPKDGLAFSPLSAVSHSIRKSFLTVYGYASPHVELICETGNNMPFLKKAETIGNCSDMVKSYAGSEGPALPGMPASVYVKVTCEQPFITALSMIAPSPDWIVQVNNVNMMNYNGTFMEYKSGKLFAYDCGTDDGGDFTPPGDASLDMPSEPQLNIVPLYKDETDPFGKVAVGSYLIEKMK